MRRTLVASAVLMVAVGVRAAGLVIDRDMTLDASYAGAGFTGDHTLTVNSADFTVTSGITNAGHMATVRLEPGGSLAVTLFEATGGGRTKVEFNGGDLTDSGNWGDPWFKTDDASSIELASVDGNAILIRHPHSQWKYLCLGSRRVSTSGTGKLEIRTASVHEGTPLYLYLNTDMTNYQHTGGTVLRGNWEGVPGWIMMHVSYCLPQGLVSLGDSAGGCCNLCLAGTTQQAEQIKGYGKSCISNTTKSASTLVFKADGSYLDAPLAGPKINVTKDGAGTTFTLKTANVPGTLLVADGVAVVQKPASGVSLVTCETLALGQSGTLRIDGVTLQVKAFENQGGTLECVNGGKLKRLASADRTEDRVISDDFPFVACDLIKAGSQTTYFCSTNALAIRSLHVAEGAVNFAGRSDSTTNKFWRFTVKSTATAGSLLHLTATRLYDANCAFCDGGSDGFEWGVYTVRYTSDADAPTIGTLQPRQMLCSANAKPFGSGGNLYPPWVMLTQSTVYYCGFDSLKPVVTDPSSWLVVGYRIPDDVNAATGYDIRSAWSGTGHCAGTWTLESSPTGADGTWSLVDEQFGQVAYDGQAWYHGRTQDNVNTSPYPISLLTDEGGGFDPSMNVQVDAEAVLDCSRCATRQTLTAITFDGARGGGTLKNVKLAATGRLDLSNCKSGCELPLTFVDSDTTGSLEGWKVYVNGQLKASYGLMWRNGKLFVPSAGLTVLVR